MPCLGRLLILSGLVLIMMGCRHSYKGEVSDHFDGVRFFNPDKEPVTEDFSMRLVEWPEWIDDPSYPPPPDKVAAGALRITHINHATILIQVDGVNILTDPIWSKRASIVSWAGPKRVRAPGVAMQDLPEIDIILISHNHYDHLDIPTLQQLNRKHKPLIMAGLGSKALLKSEGLKRVVEMDWWQEHALLSGKLRIHFVPARHNSGRGLFDRNKTLWGGYVIETTGGYIYFAGDTAYGEFLADLKKRFGAFRLALLPIGHYKPRGMMQAHHMNPNDAVKIHKLLNIKQSIAMHFATFHGIGAHNNETVDEHEKDLLRALTKQAVPITEFWVPGFGEGKNFP